MHTGTPVDFVYRGTFPLLAVDEAFVQFQNTCRQGFVMLKKEVGVSLESVSK